MYIVFADNEVDEEGFEHNFMRNIREWSYVLSRHPKRVIAFTQNVAYRERLGKLGFNTLDDHQFYSRLYGQAGNEQDSRTFRLVVLNEVISKLLHHTCRAETHGCR